MPSEGTTRKTKKVEQSLPIFLNSVVQPTPTEHTIITLQHDTTIFKVHLGAKGPKAQI